MPNKGKRSGRKSKSRENQLKTYASTNRRIDNKLRKIKRHLKKLPNDKQTEKIFKSLIK